ncbi:MAG: hypothetical protein FD167_1778, partial [bacterium]
MKKHVLSFLICLVLAFSLMIDTKATPSPLSINKAEAENVLGKMENVGRN